MQHRHPRFGMGFDVLLGNARSQAAQMTLPPGGSEGGNDNRHQGADQWLFVVSGTGMAVVSGKALKLKEGTLLLIERGETHEIRNTGERPMKTLNFYVPPAYTAEGNERPAAKS